MTHSRLAGKFEAARRDGRACFIPYLTAGDPEPLDDGRAQPGARPSGADVLKLGVPFSDPIADGPTAQRAAGRALAGRNNARGRAGVRAEGLALVLFSYVNPLFSPGFAQAMRRAAAAGFDGVLLTDVPAEEASDFLPAIAAPGLDPIFLVSPTSPEERMRKAARLSRGFLYVISRTGRRGSSSRRISDIRGARAAAPETAGRRRIRHFEGRRRCSRGRARGRRRRRNQALVRLVESSGGCRRGHGAIGPRNGGRVANTAMNDNELKRLRAAIDELDRVLVNLLNQRRNTHRDRPREEDRRAAGLFAGAGARGPPKRRGREPRAAIPPEGIRRLYERMITSRGGDQRPAKEEGREGE